MKFAPMNYHYLRYPIKKFLDKVERSPFNSIDLYCSAPQLNLFDYPLLRLIELKKEIEAHHLSVMAMTPENCVYPVNFCTQDDLTRESSIRYYQRAIDTAQFLDRIRILRSAKRRGLEILQRIVVDTGAVLRKERRQVTFGRVKSNDDKRAYHKQRYRKDAGRDRVSVNRRNG